MILAEHRRGASLGAIGALLGRSASTIGRKLWRGRPEGDPGQPYCAQLGGDRYRVLRKRCGRRRKLVSGDRLHDFVRSKLIHKRWSPEQIACRNKSMHPDDPTRLISHETIHAAICAQPKVRLKAGMIAALRQHKPARGLRRTTPAGGSIAAESLRIIHCPEETEGRLVPGHWPYGHLYKLPPPTLRYGDKVNRQWGCGDGADGFFRSFGPLRELGRQEGPADRD